ncbi:hypothetical protein BDZ89DRAFT_269610 [Hymenopellis radicata]|nr:hypothetical protein BDZ89DRAFT_269610 [Hymenopellis radicata]
MYTCWYSCFGAKIIRSLRNRRHTRGHHLTARKRRPRRGHEESTTSTPSKHAHTHRRPARQALLHVPRRGALRPTRKSASSMDTPMSMRPQPACLTGYSPRRRDPR